MKKSIRVTLFLTAVLGIVISLNSIAFAEESGENNYRASSMYQPEFYDICLAYTDPETGVSYDYEDVLVPRDTLISRYKTILPSDKYSCKDLVYTIQRALTKIYVYHKDYRCNPGNIDGSFGPNTETAVMNFQNVCNISVDGYVGNKTWECLEEHTNNQ